MLEQLISIGIIGIFILCSRHHVNMNYLLAILECNPNKIRHSKKIEYCFSCFLFNAGLLCAKKEYKEKQNKLFLTYCPHTGCMHKRAPQ